MIFIEMIHDARIIPLDGRPHLPSNVRQWMGDSRGHWEGNTLVVDTTNFTDKTRFRGASENLHLIERFTRTAAGYHPLRVHRGRSGDVYQTLDRADDYVQIGGPDLRIRVPRRQLRDGAAS